MQTYTHQKYRALSAFQEIAEEHEIEEGHGVDHASKVMYHCTMALRTGPSSKDPLANLAVEVAGALHDADDRKLFDTPPGEYANAKLILEMVFPAGEFGKPFHENVIDLISIVSCSSNGNSRPDGVDKEGWRLYPRLADRLEAIGGIGVLRAYSYTVHMNRPLFTDDTPRVCNEEELAIAASDEKFQTYMKVKSSASFIDHFYDKVFHICNFEEYTSNPYLREEARVRTQEMKSFIFSFGRNPTKTNIMRWVAKFKVQYGEK